MTTNHANIQQAGGPKFRVALCSVRMRASISLLGGLMLATALWTQQAPVLAWSILALWMLAGPVMLYWAHWSGMAYRVSSVWLLMEGLVAGALVSLVHFSLLASAMMMVACVVATIAWGGPRMRWAMPLTVLSGVLLAGWATGFAHGLQSSLFEMLACLPALIALPVGLIVGMRLMTLRMRSQTQQLTRASRLDGLSGLLNRGSWEEEVNLRMAARRLRRGSMLVLDVDHFKEVNDGWGHTTGDEVIALMGALIQAGVRTNDVAGRYGGDEFAVVLDGADVQVATVVAERIRRAVVQASIKSADGLKCTVSVGIAPIDPRMQDAREWVKAADAALYRAKRGGRDRSMVAGWPMQLVGAEAEPQTGRARAEEAAVSASETRRAV